MKKKFLHVAAFVALSMATAFAQDITVINFDGISPAFTGGDPVVSIANPVTNGINTSVNVGQLTHTGQWNDASTPVDIDPRVYTTIEMMVFSPTSVTGKVQIACYDATGGQLDWFESAVITTAGVWTKVTRNISFTKRIGKVMVGFNRNDAPSAIANDNIVYFDDLVFKKSLSTNITLYNENFFASWNQWADGTCVPSTKAGLWFGGKNLQSTGDASIILKRLWNEDSAREQALELAPAAAAVTFPDIDVAGFDNFKISADFKALAATTEAPVVEVKSGSGNWVTVATTALTTTWANQEIPLLDALGSSLIGSTISIRITPAATATYQVDFVKIIGVGSISTSLAKELNNRITIYPNPAKDFIQAKDAKSVNIFDLNGKNILSTQNVERIDIRSLQHGVFVVKVNTGSETIVSKLIKE